MLNYINCGWAYSTNLESINMLRDKSEYLLFKGWDIIIKEKVELIAGNYRVEVLKEYLCRSKSLKNK